MRDLQRAPCVPWGSRVKSDSDVGLEGSGLETRWQTHEQTGPSTGASSDLTSESSSLLLFPHPLCRKILSSPPSKQTQNLHTSHHLPKPACPNRAASITVLNPCPCSLCPAPRTETQDGVPLASAQSRPWLLSHSERRPSPQCDHKAQQDLPPVSPLSPPLLPVHLAHRAPARGLTVPFPRCPQAPHPCLLLEDTLPSLYL